MLYVAEMVIILPYIQMYGLYRFDFSGSWYMYELMRAVVVQSYDYFLNPHLFLYINRKREHVLPTLPEHLSSLRVLVEFVLLVLEFSV
jgi:hypothetical protein